MKELYLFNPFLFHFFGLVLLGMVCMLVFDGIRWTYWKLRLRHLNEEYKAVSQCETNPRIKLARLADIDREARKIERALERQFDSRK